MKIKIKQLLGFFVFPFLCEIQLWRAIRFMVAGGGELTGGASSSKCTERAGFPDTVRSTTPTPTPSVCSDWP